MLHSKTVFIVGAGASAEVGLPVGNDLKKIIAQKVGYVSDTIGGFVGGDKLIHYALRYTYASSTKYFEACSRIKDGLPLSGSIDDFVDTHQEDDAVVVCAKLAIARTIYEAENASTLSFQNINTNGTINFSTIEDTWYPAFYRLISSGLKVADIDNLFNNLTIICFNYDRCIEHFLVHATAAYFQVAQQRAKELVKGLKIYRPYGSVGDLDPSSENFAEFGFNGKLDIEKIRKNLRTYTEQIEDKESLADMKAEVATARKLVFLGNAFHDNNLKLLEDTFKKQEVERIFFTRFGISEIDLQLVKNKLEKFLSSSFGHDPYLRLQHSSTCMQLFLDHHHGLKL